MIRPTRFWIPSLMLAVILAGCSSQDQPGGEPDNSHLAYLDLSIQKPEEAEASAKATRATVSTAQYFDSGDSIGISVVTKNPLKSTYHWLNKKYVASGTATAQTWSTTGGNIGLQQDTALLSVYHPYSSSLDPTAVPVDCNTGIDYLYAAYSDWTGYGFLNYVHPLVKVTLSHSQAIIILKYINNGYIGGNNQLYGVKISGTSMGMKGTLNTTTGKVSGITDSWNHNMTSSPKILPGYGSTESVAVDTCFVIPTGAQDGQLTFTLNIDGYERSVTTTKVLLPGYIYEFPLKYKGPESPMESGDTEIEPWNSSNVSLYQMTDEDLYYRLYGHHSWENTNY
mgnify:CR=1 FL=1|jgi:hypothetical protein